MFHRERGNSIMVSVSICQAGRPGSSLSRSACFRKVEFYQNVMNLSPPVLTSMCCHVYVIMHVKDLLLSVIKVGHRVLLADFCLSLYVLLVLGQGR